MTKQKLNLADTSDLTAKEWKELELTGMVIKGDRIIRTASYRDRVARGARKEIQSTARRLFA